MRAVTIERFGDPSGMRVIETDAPDPAAREVLVDTAAIGVGGVDAVIRRRTVGVSRFAEGMVPGSEVAGTVTAVGSEVDASWVGRRVWAFTGVGGYAERALAGVDDVAELPDDLSATAAVTMGNAGSVAHFALAHARFQPGESVLVRGAAGSIGIAAVELAGHGGADAIAVTTSSADRGSRLVGLGATHVLDRAGNGGADTPESFDVIIDIVGGEDVPEFIDRLAPNGRMVVVGAVAGMPPADVGTRLITGFQHSRSLATFSLDTVSASAMAAVRAEQFAAVVRGELSAVVHETLPLERAADAHRMMDAGSVFGRSVLLTS